MTSETKTTPARKPAAKRKKPADKGQFERFVATAKEIGVDESPEALDRAFDQVSPKRSSGTNRE